MVTSAQLVSPYWAFVERALPVHLVSVQKAVALEATANGLSAQQLAAALAGSFVGLRRAAGMNGHVAAMFDPDQARDESGKWSGDGGGGVLPVGPNIGYHGTLASHLPSIQATGLVGDPEVYLAKSEEEAVMWAKLKYGKKAKVAVVAIKHDRGSEYVKQAKVIQLHRPVTSKDIVGKKTYDAEMYFDPDQARDESGKWTAGGGGGPVYRTDSGSGAGDAAVTALAGRLGVPVEIIQTYKDNGRLGVSGKIEPTRATLTTEEAEGSTYGKARPGQCYDAAGQYALYAESDTGRTLVHGTITGDDYFNGQVVSGLPIGHAWVEFADGRVLDGAVGKAYQKDSYYTLFRAVAEATYTFDEAKVQLLKNKTYGPWHQTAGVLAPKKAGRRKYDVNRNVRALFDPDQARDEDGKWSEDGGGGNGNKNGGAASGHSLTANTTEEFDVALDIAYKAQGIPKWDDYYVTALPLKGYFGSSQAFEINAALRSGTKMSVRSHEAMRSVEEGFTKYGVTLAEGTILHRAVGGEFAAQLAAMAPGTSFTDRGYLSTAGTKAATARFGKVRMELKTASGLKGLVYRHETEVLLQRGRTITVGTSRTVRGVLVISVAVS